MWSSSGNKFYVVKWDASTRAIMTNDNGSFWQGYLGYPAIAFLIVNGEVSYDAGVAKLLKGIAWKDVNQRFKNDFDKTGQYVLDLVVGRGGSVDLVKAEAARIHQVIV